MHEHVFADRILQSVFSDSERVGKKPVQVEVVVGEMLGVTKEPLGAACEIISKGTETEGSRLRMKLSEGSVECPKCSFGGRIPLRRHEHMMDATFACPERGSSLRVAAGFKVELKSTRWEEDAHAPC